MKKIATLATAAALAVAVSAPVSAQDNNVSDPFVSTQADAGLPLTTVGIGVGITTLVVTIIGLSDSSSSSTTN